MDQPQLNYLNGGGDTPLCTCHNQNAALVGWSLVFVNLSPLSLVLELTGDPQSHDETVP